MSLDRERSSRALVVDDHPIITDALSSALLSLRLFDGIDKEPSIAAASKRLDDADNYDLVVLDLHLSDTVGMESMLLMRERFPGVPLVIFSGDDSSATITAAFEQGVQGYIPKNSPMTIVISAIRVVLSGGNYIPPQAVRMLGFDSNAAPKNQLADTTALPSLSPRQREVMHYLLQGLPNKVIGKRLNMADGTVKTHLFNIYRLFSVSSRAQLILKARDVGII